MPRGGWTAASYRLVDMRVASAVPAFIEALKGAPVDSRVPQYGGTPLFEAVEEGQLAAAKLLLEKGADANAKDAQGRTALFGMMNRGGLGEAHKAVLSLLLDHKADVSVEDVSGMSAIAIATSANNKDALDMMRQRGAR